jgi:hypothetical protein
MEENQTFRKMGLALLMLRSLQRLICCSMSAPRMLIQVKIDSKLHHYQLKIGFFNVMDDIGEEMKKSLPKEG